MTRRLTLSAQIGWAEGQARQHARIASRNPPTSAARARAEEQRRLAEAAARTLRLHGRVGSGGPEGPTTAAQHHAQPQQETA